MKTMSTSFIGCVENPICPCHYKNEICFTCSYSQLYCSNKNFCGLCSPIQSQPMYKIFDLPKGKTNKQIDEINDMLELFNENPIEAKKIASERITRMKNKLLID